MDQTRKTTALTPSLGRLRRHIALQMVASALAFPAFGQAQDAGAKSTVDPAVIEKLMKRVDELENRAKQVDSLETELKDLKTKYGEMPAPEVKADTFPKLQIHVLGAVDYHVSDGKEDKNSFLLDDLDIYTLAHLSEKATVTSDLVVTSDTGGFGIEIERLMMSYAFNDYFNVDIGRFHTAMGWYNNFYHNGTYFQTTVERPSMFLFEDSEGFLPVHSTGISMHGDIPSGKLNLSYSLEVSNGGKYSADPKASFDIQDDNDSKAVNLQIRAKPDFAPNWQFGVGAYHDTLTPELDPAASPGVKTRVDQEILTAYAVYKSALWEWFNEGVAMRNAPHGDSAHWTTAAYTQVSRKFGQVRPYVRLQWRNSSDNDPVLMLIGQNTVAWGPQIGIRYDFTPMMAVKLEYEHTEGNPDGPLNEGTVQFTFRF